MLMQRRPGKEKSICSEEERHPVIPTVKAWPLIHPTIRLMVLATILWWALAVNTESWRRFDQDKTKKRLQMKAKIDHNITQGFESLFEKSDEPKQIPVVELGVMPHLPYPQQDTVTEVANEITGNPQYEKFFEKYCDPGSGSVSPWPEGDDAWQLRAPNFLIIGAKKAGTSSYWGKLTQHPFIIPGKTKELHSFQPGRLGQWIFPSQIGTKFNIEEARQALYNTSTSSYNAPLLQRYPQLLSFEATPDYLLLSDISSHIILCTAPWAKILVTLRDPVERLFSNYNFLLQHIPSLNVTFEEWVRRDIVTLRHAGVIPGAKDATKVSGKAEQEWWKYYQNMSRLHSPERQVGRSLYVLQLEAWIRWMREAGRDPQKGLRVVWQEDLRHNPNRTLNDIAQWLGLPEYSFNVDTKFDLMVTNYSTAMSHVTRSKLERFFAPYNTRLQNLLQRERITFPASN